MPKIGAPKGAADRPYRTVCEVCGCLCEKAVSRFGYTGEPVAWAYVCQIWQHRCGTEDREACKPRRVYTDTPEGAAEVAALLEQQKTRALSDETDPWAEVRGSAEFVELLRQGGYCFEGDCGQCAACKLKAAGY